MKPKGDSPFLPPPGPEFHWPAGHPLLPALARGLLSVVRWPLPSHGKASPPPPGPATAPASEPRKTAPPGNHAHQVRAASPAADLCPSATSGHSPRTPVIPWVPFLTVSAELLERFFGETVSLQLFMLFFFFTFAVASWKTDLKFLPHVRSTAVRARIQRPAGRPLRLLCRAGAVPRGSAAWACPHLSGGLLLGPPQAQGAPCTSSRRAGRPPAQLLAAHLPRAPRSPRSWGLPSAAPLPEPHAGHTEAARAVRWKGLSHPAPPPAWQRRALPPRGPAVGRVCWKRCSGGWAPAPEMLLFFLLFHAFLTATWPCASWPQSGGPGAPALSENTVTFGSSEAALLALPRGQGPALGGGGRRTGPCPAAQSCPQPRAVPHERPGWTGADVGQQSYRAGAALGLEAPPAGPPGHWEPHSPLRSGH